MNGQWIEQGQFYEMVFSFLACSRKLFSVGLHANDSVLQQAYKSQQSDLQVQGFGKVVKVLPDDNDGSKHQKFILKLNSGQTLLVAHNIDLAPRIPTYRLVTVLSFMVNTNGTKRVEFFTGLIKILKIVMLMVG